MVYLWVFLYLKRSKKVNSILSQKHNRGNYEWFSCFLIQEEISRYKKLYQEMFTERNQLKQQCTQAIRQWDSAIRERNDYKDQYTKVTMHNNTQYSVCVNKNIYTVNVRCTYLVSQYNYQWDVVWSWIFQKNTKHKLAQLTKYYLFIIV